MTKKSWGRRRPGKEQLETIIRTSWDQSDRPPDQKTYYIIEHLYHLFRENRDQHIFALELFIELNEQSDYDAEMKKEILKRLNQALKEL